jgi:hypothetical protein
MDTKEKSLLDGVRAALAETFSLVASWLSGQHLTETTMDKLTREIEEVIDRKVIPEFAKVNKKLDDQAFLVTGLYTALGKTPPAPPNSTDGPTKK